MRDVAADDSEMTPDGEWDRAQVLEIAEGFAEGFAEGLIASGELDPVGKSRDEVLHEAARMVLANPSMLMETDFRLSHEGDLLAEARKYAASPPHADFAVMMYATWLEHRLNLLLMVGANLKGMSDEEARKIIRNANIREKTGATLRDLLDQELSPTLAAQIRRVADRRNEFVHYKWPTAKAESPDVRAEIVRTAEEAVSALDRFYRRRVLRGFGLDEA